MTTDASPDPGPVEVAAVAAVRAVAEPVWWGTHLREVRWQAELARLLADPVWRGTGLPRGDGEPVRNASVAQAVADGRNGGTVDVAEALRDSVRHHMVADV